VILSGTGWDGAMPQFAAATGCVDFVLPPEDVAAELVRIEPERAATDGRHRLLPLPGEHDQTPHPAV
jgi:hypothetical protein